MSQSLFDARSLTHEQREYLRQQIAREAAARATAKECLGCGASFSGSPRKRYCSVACANRHWHIRRKTADPEYRHAR